MSRTWRDATRLKTSVVPSVVLSSPGRLAPEARNAAVPSVVPATTTTSRGKLNRSATSLRSVARCTPDSRTSGKRLRSSGIASSQPAHCPRSTSKPDFNAFPWSVTPKRPVSCPAMKSAWWAKQSVASNSPARSRWSQSSFATPHDDEMPAGCPDDLRAIASSSRAAAAARTSSYMSAGVTGVPRRSRPRTVPDVPSTQSARNAERSALEQPSSAISTARTVAVHHSWGSCSCIPEAVRMEVRLADPDAIKTPSLRTTAARTPPVPRSIPITWGSVMGVEVHVMRPPGQKLIAQCRSHPKPDVQNRLTSPETRPDPHPHCALCLRWTVTSGRARLASPSDSSPFDGMTTPDLLAPPSRGTHDRAQPRH